MTFCEDCPTLLERIADLEAENARLRDDVRQLAERVAICSELLGKKAEQRKPHPAACTFAGDP